MTWNIDQDREDEEVLRDSGQSAGFGAAVAVSVLVIATITLTLVAGGLDIVSLFP